MRFGRVKHPLVLTAALTGEKGISGRFKMKQRLGILFACQRAPLVVQQSVLNDLNYVFQTTAVHADFRHRSVLKRDVDEGAVN